MPSLYDLTNDQQPQQDSSLPVAPQRVYVTLPDNSQPPAPIVQPDPNVPASTSNSGSVGTSPTGKIIDRLLGLNGEERYQLWPEKVVREALAAPHDVMTGETPQYAIDPTTGDVHTSPQMIEGAQAVSALAGSGGLAGTTDATLGATPFLRPALKYGDKIYKAPVGGQHLDALPAHLADEFQKLAMSGEDINHYNFGFMNHKGQFLDREKALDYAIKEGLVDPHAGQYGALTSTLLADSSKPGTAIEAMAKTGKPDRPYANVPDSLMGFRKNGQQKGFYETSFKHEQPVRVTFLDSGDTFNDIIKGLNAKHAEERAYRNWPGAKIELLADSSKPGTAIEAMAKTSSLSKQAEGLRRYYSQRSWASEEEARAQIKRKIERENVNANGFFAPTDPNVVDEFAFVKHGKGVKISQAGTTTRKPIEILDEPTGSAPSVDWTRPDLVNRGSAQSAFEKYGRGIGEAKQGYISLSNIPKEKLAGGKKAYDWNELQSNRSDPPPATIRINKNGTTSILDGNHRIANWREQGHDQIPAFIIDERPKSVTLRADKPGTAIEAMAKTGSPYLEAAIRDNGKVYRGKDHLEALSNAPTEDRARLQLDGSNRGWMNDKGRFLNRERAQKYAVENDLIKEGAPSWVHIAPEAIADWLKPRVLKSDNEAKL